LEENEYYKQPIKSGDTHDRDDLSKLPSKDGRCSE
jgi:hypothetical protein